MLRRLLVIAVVGLVIGVLAVAILSALYANSRSVHNIMTPTAYGVTSVVVFFLAFGITVLVLALTFVSRDEWADLLATGNDSPAPAARRSSAPVAEDFEPEAPAEKKVEKPAPAAPSAKLGTATAAATNPKAVPTPAPKPAQNWTGARRDDPQDLSSSPPPIQHAVPTPPKIPAMDMAKTEAAKVIELSIAGLANFGLKVDDRTRLGCALYLAGAAEALAEKHKLKEGEALSVVESCIDLLNGGPTFAEGFSKEYLQHLKKKENAAIFGAGRSGVLTGAVPAPVHDGLVASVDLSEFDKHHDIDPNTPPVRPSSGAAPSADVLAQPEPPPAPPVPSLPGLAIALDAWLGDDPASAAQSGEAVLVAEMEAPPSPEAQDTTSLNRIEVSRRVMRRALRTTGGIALKQSWGGIVASFPQSADAIAAAAEMQRGASEHTALFPLESVVLKIGVATDRVGQRDRTMPPAVELASRFLRHAKGGEIIADRISCLGGGELGKAAKDRGTLALAGVVRPIQISTVEWRNRFPVASDTQKTATPGAAGPASNQAATTNAQSNTIKALSSQSFHAPASPAGTPTAAIPTAQAQSSPASRKK